MSARPLGWLGIVRLGLVQTALGAIVVLTTSTMNRVMVVELALPAMVPGLLVGLHYAVQLMRPRLGHGSDVGGRRTPWIVGGMAMLALGGVCAAVATAWMGSDRGAGFAFGLLAFTLIGLGVGAAGTSLLVLLAKRVAAQRRAAAATIVWIMMIAGFAITATAAGHLLDPFSPARLIAVTAGVGVAAFLLTLVAVRNVEGPGYATAQAVDRALAGTAAAGTAPGPAFRAALAQVWAEPQARRFTVFVFVSMLAYSLQDLILEPFAGTVFGLTPGESTKLSGVQHGGVLLGMLMVAVAGSRAGALRTWMVGGCVASALALLALATAGLAGPGWPLRATVFALGLANGAFAVAAIGTMMALASSGEPSREGIRMGMWGAAQAVAFGLGGFLGTAASDLARQLLGSPLLAYATVFSAEGLLFLISAALALRVGQVRASVRRPARRGDFLVGIERGRTT
jgi:BCD family chlorophyll transporter-like MFS transporter